MEKLLFAYDGSSQADAVVEDLQHAGLPESLAATVLCVADVWLPRNPPELLENAVSGVQRSYEQALSAVEDAGAMAESAAVRLRDMFPNWMVQAESRGDSPPWAVVEYAKDWNADLVVVGAHSHSALQRLFLGSVAGKVTAEAPCSVRVARPRPLTRQNGLRLTVAVDGSSDSIEAVRAVAARSWPAACQCRVVTVLDPKLRTASAFPGTPVQSWRKESDQEIEDTADWARHMTEHMAGMLREAGLTAEARVLEGDPKKELLHEAEEWDANCIFLGAQGLHHRDRLHLGTLANAVSTRAHCTVEIVRRPK